MDQLATFGGGCFWCVEQPFDNVSGVLEAFPGYMGGQIKDPSYQQVCSGQSGHVEVVQIGFDESVVNYQDLLTIFLRNIDPTDESGQFADRGSQYRPVIFYHGESQKEMAKQTLGQLDKSGRFTKRLAVAVEAATTFYQAEGYHCRYFEKQSASYENYKAGSGRRKFIDEHWPE